MVIYKLSVFRLNEGVEYLHSTEYYECECEAWEIAGEEQKKGFGASVSSVYVHPKREE